MPYYITTPIINKFIEENIVPDVMVMMVQKEVAERLSASVGTSDYGAISAILNYFYVIESSYGKYIGVSPSGKASDSDSDIPVFESQCPSQY